MGYDEEEKDKWLRRRVTVNRKEVIFEYIMAQNVPKLTKDIKSQIGHFKRSNSVLSTEETFTTKEYRKAEQKKIPTFKKYTACNRLFSSNLK